MIIHVLDEGKGFDLGGVPNPLAEENLLSTSGRGIFLMRAFMDEFEVVPGRTGVRKSSCQEIAFVRKSRNQRQKRPRGRTEKGSLSPI